MQPQSLWQQLNPLELKLLCRFVRLGGVSLSRLPKRHPPQQVGSMRRVDHRRRYQVLLLARLELTLSRQSRRRQFHLTLQPLVRRSALALQQPDLRARLQLVLLLLLPSREQQHLPLLQRTRVAAMREDLR